MEIIYGDTFDEESTLESFITMSTATKESTINGSTVHSIQAPPTLACDGRDDDEDELELIEGGSFIEDGPSVQGTRSAEDTGVATPNDYWEYAASRFTTSYKEFTKAINEFDESAGIKCKETADTIVDTARKFPKEHRDAYYDFVDLIEDASAYSDTTCGSMSCNTDSTCSTGYTTACGRSGVTEATGYTTATNVTDTTGKTGCTTTSGRSGVTEATATNATGLTGPTHERPEKYAAATNVTEATGKTACTTKSGRSGVTEANATNATGRTGPTRERPEKYTSIEVVYNSEVDRTLGPQVTKKTRECERSVPSNFSKKSRATQRSGTNATGLTGPTRERPEKYPAIEVVYNNQADRTKGPQVTKKNRECPPHERSKLSNVPDEVPSHGGEDNSIFGGDATQRSSILPIASSERPSLGDLEPSDQLSNVSAKRRASVLKPSDLTLDRSLAQTIPSDLTITGRPGRYESYITSRFGVTWGNAEKAAAPIAENIPIL